jgi:glutaredoxin
MRYFVLMMLVAFAYGGYQKFYKDKSPAEEVAGEAGQGQVLQTSNPNFYGTMENGQPVLRMKPETLASMQQVAGTAKVVMFATSWCPYCKKARQVFADKGIRYTEVDVEVDQRGAAYQKDIFGSTGVPLIVMGNRVMMGYDEGELLRGLREI